MDRKTVIPPEIELELKKFELKISKLNKEEMFKELMLLKFDSENNFYFIRKYLSKHGMKISRQIIQSHCITIGSSKDAIATEYGPGIAAIILLVILKNSIIIF